MTNSLSILTLCTGNICRSPVAEAVLSSALVGTGITVSSAGTHAAAGTAAAPEAVSYIQGALGTHVDHRARRLDRTLLSRPDLILTMTVEQRGWVAAEEPRVLRRTFTMLELARIVPELPSAAGFADLRTFAHACAKLRTRNPAQPSEQDIADPYGGPSAGYTRSFTQVHAAAGVIAQAVVRTVASEQITGPRPGVEGSP